MVMVRALRCAKQTLVLTALQDLILTSLIFFLCVLAGPSYTIVNSTPENSVSADSENGQGSSDSEHGKGADLAAGIDAVTVKDDSDGKAAKNEEQEDRLQRRAIQANRRCADRATLTMLKRIRDT